MDTPETQYASRMLQSKLDRCKERLLDSKLATRNWLRDEDREAVTDIADARVWMSHPEIALIKVDSSFFSQQSTMSSTSLSFFCGPWKNT